MAVKSKKRATSTLTPVPTELQSPASTRQVTEGTMTSDANNGDRAKTRKEIINALKSDVLAFHAARKGAIKALGTANLESADLNEQLAAVALNKIQERKLMKKHVSCKYPVFENYVPAAVHGKHASETAQQQDQLIERQLDRLCGRPPTFADEEDDREEMPQIKKQESEETEDPQSVPPYMYVAKTEGKSTKGKVAGQSHVQNGSNNTRSLRRHKDFSMREESSGDFDESEDEDEEVSDTESELSELESSAESDDEQDDEHKYEHEAEGDVEDQVPLIAVCRGRPLSDELPKFEKAYKNLKQHFATGIKCVEQAVVRGQVPNNNDQAKAACEENKDVVSKKRTRPEHEDGGRKLKKVKAEAKASCRFASDRDTRG